MWNEYTFTCVYCGTETLNNEPYPNATWTKDYNETGWVCSYGQCQETLSEEPMHLNAEKRFNQEAMEEKKRDGRCFNPWCDNEEWDSILIGHQCSCGNYIWHKNEYEKFEVSNA
jgi:hypothetical protein